MMRFRSLILSAAVAAPALLAAGGPALAEDGRTGYKQAGDFLVRARAVAVIADESTDEISGIGGDVIVDNDMVPEVDLSYFLTDNIAVEVIAAVANHDARVEGSAVGDVDLGSVYLLPPTITAQWHFNPKGRFSPYVGAGVHVIWFFEDDDTRLDSGPVTDVDYDPAVGGVIQGGIDYFINDNLLLNLDVKRSFVNVDADVSTVLGDVDASFDLDPWLVGVGIGYRF